MSDRVMPAGPEDGWFTFAKPPLGSAKGAVVVDDNAISIEHPLVKDPVRIPSTELAAVVRLAGTDHTDIIPARKLRRLDLVPSPFTRTNVLLFTKATFRTPPFTYGANQSLSIRGRERRDGAKVDIFGVAVAEPDGLVTMIGGLGIPVYSELSSALVRVAGVATPDEAAARRADERRARRRTNMLATIGCVLITAVLSFRVALPDNGGAVDWARVAIHLSWSLLAAAGVALVIAAPANARPVDRLPFALLIGVLICAPLVPGVAWALMPSGHWLKTPLAAVWAGLPTGVIVGLTLRHTRPA